MLFRYYLPAFASLAALPAAAQTPAPAPTRAQDSAFVRQTYRKLDRLIPMRDGVKLYTIAYVPRDAGKAHPYPILLNRTPYGAGPRGEENYPLRGPSPSRELGQEKYIFVYQDVRGRYLSEGQFEEMTPALPTAATDRARRAASGPQDHDESTDTYDTVEWLLKNIPGHNGRVGLMGVSYPGFYATASLPTAHPAIRAVSPQAPMSDEFMGDDANHNGAFFLLDNFDFTNFFDIPRPQPTAKYAPLFPLKIDDSYAFFQQLGSLQNANLPQYFGGRARVWNEFLAHPTYDAYWQARNIRPHLTGIRPAVLVVGGWFDAEDLFGALHTYQAIEQQNPRATNRLVMGPWTHGAWHRTNWSSFGPLRFGQNTAEYYRRTLEMPFFNYYLKGQGSYNPAEATCYDTGLGQWQTFASWPPAGVQSRAFYCYTGGRLSEIPRENELGKALRTKVPGPPISAIPTTLPPAPEQFSYTEYRSDPAHPVPYTAAIQGGRNDEYMIEDQRFAAQRPDVLSFQTMPLAQPLTVAGPLTADLWVSTTGTDADFVVKLIDVLPDSAATPGPGGAMPAGAQRLVRAEVFRGRFRNSFEHPEAFRPGEPAQVKFALNDVLHTFRPSHRLMVQVQSTWFPLVDLNPQRFVNIPTASPADFQPATIRLYHEPGHESRLLLPVR